VSDFILDYAQREDFILTENIFYLCPKGVYGFFAERAREFSFFGVEERNFAKSFLIFWQPVLQVAKTLH